MTNSKVLLISLTELETHLLAASNTKETQAPLGPPMGPLVLFIVQYLVLWVPPPP